MSLIEEFFLEIASTIVQTPRFYLQFGFWSLHRKSWGVSWDRPSGDCFLELWEEFHHRCLSPAACYCPPQETPNPEKKYKQIMIRPAQSLKVRGETNACCVANIDRLRRRKPSSDKVCSVITKQAGIFNVMVNGISNANSISSGINREMSL